MYEHGYVINAVDGLKTKDPVPWDRYAAAFDGSSFLQVPPLLKFFTLGIEYHHIHHFRTRIPGYMLRKCHEGAPPGMWDGVPFLSWADLYRSLLVQCYDIDSRQYKTFAEVDASLKAR